MTRTVWYLHTPPRVSVSGPPWPLYTAPSTTTLVVQPHLWHVVIDRCRTTLAAGLLHDVASLWIIRKIRKRKCGYRYRTRAFFQTNRSRKNFHLALREWYVRRYSVSWWHNSWLTSTVVALKSVPPTVTPRYDKSSNYLLHHRSYTCSMANTVFYKVH